MQVDEAGPEDETGLEAALQAYVDGRLTEAERTRIRAYLAVNPPEAARVRVYVAQRQALRTGLAQQAQARLQRRRAMLAGGGLIAATVATLIVDRRRRGARAIRSLMDEADAAHRRYALGAMPPDVAAPRLNAWVAARLRTVVAVPDLLADGFRAVGGFEVTTGLGEWAMLVVFQASDKLPLSWFLHPVDPGLSVAETERDSGALRLCGWIAHGLGSALAAALPGPLMDRLADHVRDALPQQG